MFDLSGMTALVTGASGGIGSAIAVAHCVGEAVGAVVVRIRRVGEGTRRGVGDRHRAVARLVHDAEGQRVIVRIRSSWQEFVLSSNQDSRRRCAEDDRRAIGRRRRVVDIRFLLIAGAQAAADQHQHGNKGPGRRGRIADVHFVSETIRLAKASGCEVFRICGDSATPSQGVLLAFT